MTRRQHRAARRISKLVEGRFGPNMRFPKGTRILGVSFTGEEGQPLRISVDLFVEDSVSLPQAFEPLASISGEGPPCSKTNPNGCPDA